jgi:hypothetical protein
MYTAPSDYASFLATASEREPLRLVVRVNKGIREVIGISRRVNLVALNAMLAAQQSGAQQDQARDQRSPGGDGLAPGPAAASRRRRRPDGAAL